MASLTFQASAPSSFNQQEGKEKEEDHIEDFHKLRLEMTSIGLATFQGAEFGHLTIHTQGKPRSASNLHFQEERKTCSETTYQSLPKKKKYILIFAAYCMKQCASQTIQHTCSFLVVNANSEISQD